MKIIKTKLKTKKTIICKNVEVKFLRKDMNQHHKVVPGDVAIFQVKAIGKHTRIQTTTGNNAFILPGDNIVAAFGNRYASEQFEGFVPTEPVTEYHILGQGGAIGVVASMHKKFELIGPTTLRLVGYVTDDKGNIINTKRAICDPDINKPVPTNAKIILSLGSGMDSGKTTSAAFLTRGLVKAGKKVVYIKLTGTVYTRDKRFVSDHGAIASIDFSDLGFPSTFMCSKKELIGLHRRLIRRTSTFSPDYIIIEIADGLLQRETEMLLKSDDLRQHVFGVIYSSGDSLSAIYGTELLFRLGYKVLAITGLLTTSPLSVNEVKSHTKTPVLLEEDIVDKTINKRLKL
jgi:hypothetical protein